MKKNAKSPNMRSPRSTANPRPPTSYTARGVGSRNLEITEESDISEYEIDKGDDPGVRYITEVLIRKLSKQENLAFVTSLNLSLSKEGGKKFKYIEGLDKCDRLEVLNLSYNLIEKIEKLEKLTRIRDLNLSHNRISKIEGLEHLHSLQKLNLSGNEIEHVPAWLGKKVKALNILNLKQNKIFSLQDVSRLKPLKDLTSLFLADNPIANLPHYRLYTIFHLRCLNSLDGQPIVNQERQDAHDRFNIEEVEKLERDLEKKIKEMEELQSQKTKVSNELQSQDELNKSLRHEAQQHKKSYKELEREMDTKSEIRLSGYLSTSSSLSLCVSVKLKQKTLELTRACQKQYELEQELAFYKIDAKFEPLGYVTSEDVDLEDAPEESPYIGKARYKRNLYAQEGFIADRAQQMQVGKIELDGDDQIKNQQIRARIHTTLDVDLGDKERNIQAAQARLAELRQEIAHSEQQILRATQELKELEEAAAQRKVSEAEKEKLRQQLSSKIQLLNQLRQEAQALEGELDRQRSEIDKKHREIEELQRHLEALSPWDPRHAHVKAQKASKEQQLEMMDGHYKQLEERLDEMLSRIARETEEIKDLEQQLTEGQIAANEALKKDLEGIISGLQEYLESIKGQAKQAHDECRELQSERELLLQRLEELEEERERLEAAALDAGDMQKEIEELERRLQEQQEENESLRRAQGDLGAYEAQLTAQEAEVSQLREELDRRKRQGQAEKSALRAELDRELRALETAQSKAHLLEEKEKDAKKLQSQVTQLQRENASLKKHLENLQTQMDEALDNLVHPEQITARVSELKRKLQTGVGEMKCSGPSDVLGQSLAELQQQMNDILSKGEVEKREAQERQRKLQEEIAALQERAREAPGDYKRACNKAAEAKIQLEKRQNEARVQELENEVRQLHERLRTMEDIQGLADQQLVEADEERERLLAELHDLENERRTEDSRAQKQFSGLNKELKELKRALAMSDKMAASELTDAKDQLKSLHGTVRQINRERAEEIEEADNFCAQAAQGLRDLAKAEAEIELLQELLQDREKQLHDELQNAETGANVSNAQQLEIDQLNHTLRKQRAEIERLKHLLDHVTAGNAGEIEGLLDDIESLRHALSCQNDYITSMADPFRRRGYWYYVPSSSNNSGRDSLSTKDSGVSLRFPMTSSPARRKAAGRKEEFAPPASGHWVYSPFRHGQHRCHNNRDDDAWNEADVAPSGHFVPPPGSVMYTVFPDGTPVPQGTVIYGAPPPSAGRPLAPGSVIYGPPPMGTQYVYGPPPPQFMLPVIPAGVLHCNVSAHHSLENEMNRLEDIIDHLKSRQQKEKKTKARLMGDIEDLQNERGTLKEEVEQLRKSAQKRKNLVEGHLDGLLTELELERSLQHHDNIEDEIECIEKTLLKRRAELRESDRLLTKAETELKNTQEKTMDLIEKYNAAKKHLSQTERDAEELERRAQETAMNLVKADQQLRVLQANARDLEQHRASQENILQEINSVVTAKDAEFQSLNGKIVKLTDSLQKLQDDIQEAEGKEDHQLQTLQQAEDLLAEKKTSLERLICQISAQQEEVTRLDRLLGQKKEELHLLQDHIDQKKGDLKDVLREGELDVADKREEIKEVKSVLNDLCVQKGEVSAQLNEKRAELALLRQEVAQEDDNLQKILSQIHKQKSELKHVLEMQQLEDNELQGLKVQHDQKMNDLEKTQSLLLQGKLELENLQRTLQRLHGEVDWQRQLLEKDHREIELLMTQMHTLQAKVETLNSEKEYLAESGQELERKLARNKKALADTEESNRTATAAMGKLESDIKSLQNDLGQLSKQREFLRQETASAQQQLQEKREEVALLKDELSDLRDQLRTVEQDLRNATKHRDDILSNLKEDTAETVARYKLLQEEERSKEERLRQLQGAIEEAVHQLTKQEGRLKQMMKDAEGQEEQLRKSAAKLEDERLLYEREQVHRESTLEMISSKVSTMEERALVLQQEEKWCAALEESLTSTRHHLSEREEQLREKTSALSALQKELESCRNDLSSLEDRMAAERKRDEKRIAALKEAVSSQRVQFEDASAEQKQENNTIRKQLISVEQAAYDNHERAKRLLKELKLLEAEHAALRKELKSQEELDKRQQEVNEAVRALKAQVKVEIQSTLQDLHCAEEDGLEEDVGDVLEQNQSLQSQLETLKENFPFSANSASQDEMGRTRSRLTDEHWRGDALREKLRQHEDRLKAELHHRMSKQADVLSRGRRQTEGCLHSLRRRVDALDELVSNVSSDSPFHSHNFSGEDLRSQSLKPSSNISPITEPRGISTQSLHQDYML
ncbi:centriolin isoform X2 [Pseudophryne corroboree]|uniref:centriolin isoform X2 n=1 Tax=Pseudophryne corroboree TaxID=495146 RepID=UPI0030819B2D